MGRRSSDANGDRILISPKVSTKYGNAILRMDGSQLSMMQVTEALQFVLGAVMPNLQIKANVEKSEIETTRIR